MTMVMYAVMGWDGPVGELKCPEESNLCCANITKVGIDFLENTNVILERSTIRVQQAQSFLKLLNVLIYKFLVKKYVFDSTFFAEVAHIQLKSCLRKDEEG